MKGKHIVNFLAYVSIALIALALVLELIFSKVGINAAVVNAMNIIAECIAYAITAVFAFFYARSRRNIGYMIGYFVAVVLIVVLVIL